MLVLGVVGVMFGGWIVGFVFGLNDVYGSFFLFGGWIVVIVGVLIVILIFNVLFCCCVV